MLKFDFPSEKEIEKVMNEALDEKLKELRESNPSEIIIPHLSEQTGVSPECFQFRSLDKADSLKLHRTDGFSLCLTEIDGEHFIMLACAINEGRDEEILEREFPEYSEFKSALKTLS